jgi:signal transduction histidine kinase
MRPSRSDVAPAGALLALAALELGLARLGPAPVAAAVVVAVALAWRRRAPVASAGVVLATLAVISVSAQAGGLWMALAAIVAVYSVAAHAERWPALLVAGLWCLAGALAIAREDNRDAWEFLGNFAFFAVLLTAAPWLAGRVVRRRQARATQLEDHAATVERESDERARAAVAEERLRIARELHDVVGHALGTIVVQAGAERATRPAAPESTRTTLLTIERTGREALGEMRRLLDLMRRADDRVALAPQPRLDQLPELIDGVRATGLPVELAVDGEPHALAPGVDLAAYRIVQEALTNTLKHAGPAHARVRIRYTPTALELDVADDGESDADGAGAEPSGHGLIGMRERVALLHGSLTTGARREGGYQVSARLPYGP